MLGRFVTSGRVDGVILKEVKLNFNRINIAGEESDFFTCQGAQFDSPDAISKQMLMLELIFTDQTTRNHSFSASLHQVRQDHIGLT